MSWTSWLQLLCRALEFACLAGGARIAWQLSRRIALEVALYAGASAFVFLHLEETLTTLPAALTAPLGGLLLGALLGVGLGRLDPARATAAALALALAISELGLGSPWTGAYMGLGRTLEPGVSLAGLALLLAVGAALAAWRARWTPWLDRARLVFFARPLAESLGWRRAPSHALVGALVGVCAGLGGTVFALGAEHLHVRAFGLGTGIDALALGLLARRPLPIFAASALWAAAEIELAELPAARTALVGLALASAAWLEPRSEPA